MECVTVSKARSKSNLCNCIHIQRDRVSFGVFFKFLSYSNELCQFGGYFLVLMKATYHILADDSVDENIRKGER